jgi:CRP-like cAMP-binding protein
MAYLIPGDACDVHVALLKQMDHSIGSLSPCKVAFLSDEAVTRIISENGNLARALWWSTLVDEAVTREWLVNMGRRDAEKGIGHLLCEMLLRSRAVGLAADDSFPMPLTQEELADTLGISSIHMNRMLQGLRGKGLIATDGKRVTVKDLAALMDFVGFDPTYLHQKAGLA